VHCVVRAIHAVAKDNLHAGLGPGDLVSLGKKLVLNAFGESMEPGGAEAAVTLGDGAQGEHFGSRVEDFERVEVCLGAEIDCDDVVVITFVEVATGCA
jgi:hypothetical protein